MKKSKYNYTFQKDNKFYLYNPYIGLLKMSENLYNQYENRKIEFISSEFLKILVDKKYVIEDEIDEYERIQLIREKLKYGQDTLLLKIAPILECNCNCEYCFVEKSKEKMDLETENAIIKFLKKKIRQGVKVLKITWFGGEPLLAFERIQSLSEKIICLCEKNNVHYQAFLITNGILLTPKIVSQIQLLKIVGLQITLDGTEEYHNFLRPCNTMNGYKKIFENLLLFNGSIKPSIRINVSKRNCEDIVNLLNCLNEREEYIKDISFSSIFSINHTPEKYKKYVLEEKEYADFEKNYLKYLKKTNLKVAHNIKGKYITNPACILNSFCIDPKGNLYKSEFMLGNVNYIIETVDKYDLIEFSYKKNFLQYVIKNEFEDKCKACFYFPYCLGGEGTMVQGKCDSIKYNFEVYLEKYIDDFEG